MKLFSTKINNGAFNTGMLLLRLIFGVLMMHHGYQKMMNFSGMKDNFMNFLHLGSTISLSLVIFAEFFCAALVILGLFTRFTAFVIVFEMAVALFMAHNLDVFGKGELAFLYLTAFLTLVICGPGKVSVDGMISK
jgi:putative oxidoreductase